MLISVHGKGRKERIVPMCINGRKLLYRWLQTHKPALLFAPTAEASSANGTRCGSPRTTASAAATTT